MNTSEHESGMPFTYKETELKGTTTLKVTTINQLVRDHEEKVTDWVHSNLAKQLYIWFDRFNEEFFGGKLEQCVISFEKTRLNNLGHYVLELNSLGLQDNINLNETHARQQPLSETLSTLLHEMVHQYQRRLGSFSEKENRKKYTNYHNKEFLDMVASFGLIHNKKGQQIERPKGRFVSFLTKYEVKIEEAIHITRDGIGSKLIKYSCECSPAINIRVAVSNFSATCNLCKKDFQRK